MEDAAVRCAANSSHPRRPMIVKWLGLVTCSALASTYVLAWGYVGRTWSVHVEAGVVILRRWVVGHEPYPPPVAQPLTVRPGLRYHPGSESFFSFLYREVLNCFGFRRAWYIYTEVPLALTAILTALAWWRWARWIPPGHCRGCGYDLRGVINRRCPECGRPFLGRIPVDAPRGTKSGRRGSLS